MIGVYMDASSPSRPDALVLLDPDAPLWVIRQKWTIDGTGYPVANIDGRKVSLHRAIARARPGQIVDHINRDKADCRSVNLRIASHRGNRNNTAGRAGTSQYKGVSLRDGKWRAQIRADGKSVHLGTFESEEAAALAYNAAAAKEHGEYACLNSVSLKGALCALAIVLMPYLPGCASMPPQEIDQLHRDLRAAWVPWPVPGIEPPARCDSFAGDCNEYAICAGRLATERGLESTPVITGEHAATIVVDGKGGAWIVDTLNPRPVRAWQF